MHTCFQLTAKSRISRSFSIRLLILSWWMFVCLITACYSANLAATLTVQKFDNEIKSVEELLSSKNQFRFATTVYLWRHLKNSKSDFHQKIAQSLDGKITVVENTTTFEQGLVWVLFSYSTTHTRLLLF